MTRHVLDHRTDAARPDDASRLEAAARKTAPEGAHPAARSALRRKQAPAKGRVPAFLKIDRGARA